MCVENGCSFLSHPGKLPIHPVKGVVMFQPKDNIRRLELFRTLGSVAEIAQAEGVRETTIREWMKRQGLRPYWQSQKHARRLEMVHKGMTIKEMAKAEKVAEKTIEDWGRVKKVRLNWSKPIKA
jgi:transposase